MPSNSVIDLTEVESPPPSPPPPPLPPAGDGASLSNAGASRASSSRARSSSSTSSASSTTSASTGPLVASRRAILAAIDDSLNNNNNNANTASTSSSTSNARPPPPPAHITRRLPHPNNTQDAPIDLTDDDIEFIGEHRLQFPERPHITGNEANPPPNEHNYGIMDRLRDVAGMPFSRHAQAAASSPSASASAGPGPAAVAAANARATRRSTRQATTTTSTTNTNTRQQRINDEVADPPAGLNARRSRQRERNNAVHNNNNAPDFDYQVHADDPGDYYYRRRGSQAGQPPASRPQPQPQPRQPRGGRGAGGRFQGVADVIDNYAGWDDILQDWHNQDLNEEDDNDYANDPDWNDIYGIDGMGDELVEVNIEQGIAQGGGNDNDNNNGGNRRRAPQRNANRGRRAAGDGRVEGNRARGRGGHLPGYGNGYAPYVPRAAQGIYNGILEMLGFNPPNQRGGGHNARQFDNVIMNGFPMMPLGIGGMMGGQPPRRKVKPYSVKQSHPNFNKKKDGKGGFERDIIPPPEEEEKEENEKVLPEEASVKVAYEKQAGTLAKANAEDSASNGEDISAAKDVKGKGKARAEADNEGIDKLEQDDDGDVPRFDLDAESPTATASSNVSSLSLAQASTSTRATSADANDDSNVKMDNLPVPVTVPPSKPPARSIRVPVCASCAEPLWLNQPSSGRPYILVCGHVVCRGCLDAATQRLKQWTSEDPQIVGENGMKTDISVPPLTSWKGNRLKETFEEIDSAPSISDTNSRDRKSRSKGKKRARIDETETAEQEEEADKPTTSTSSRTRKGAATAVGTRTSRRRNIPVPNYEEQDIEVEMGEIDDDNYVGTDSGVDKSTTVSSKRDKGKGKAKEEEGDRVETKPRRKTKKELDEEEDIAAGLVVPEKKKQSAEIEVKPTENADELDMKPSTSTQGKRKRAQEDETTAAAATNDEGDEVPVKPLAKKQKKGKGAVAKGPPKEKEAKLPLFDPHWLTCPVRACQGDTDLSSPVGSLKGAWEMFV